ncbi:unnamed protein product [Effrenium voratum]|nr:unnamed protein product [Effrenium voratum]
MRACGVPRLQPWQPTWTALPSRGFRSARPHGPHGHHSPGGLDARGVLALALCLKRRLASRTIGHCAPELIEGWVVKYRLPEPKATALGLAVVDATGRLQPLCTWEEGERTFVVDEDAEAIDPEDRVAHILEIEYSHRQMPRPVNPHGEEVEDTYYVDDDEDLGDVEIVVRSEVEPSAV